MSSGLINRGSDRTLWVYLLVFDKDFGDTQTVQEYLKELESVDWWYRCLPNAIFVTSYLTAKNLSKKLMERFSGGRHLILDCDTDYHGFLPTKAWILISNPKKRGEE